MVGHILFSPATVEAGGRTDGSGADGGAPRGATASAPGWSRPGALDAPAARFVIVLGHPDYYPRFGFERASAHGIDCQWQVPDEAFMIRILDAEAMAGAAGVAHYRPEFDTVI